MNVGDCVVVPSAQDAGWIQAIHAGGDDVDVYLQKARVVRTFAVTEIVPIPADRTGTEFEYLQGPYLVRFEAKVNNGWPVLKIRALKFDENGVRVSDWARVL